MDIGRNSLRRHLSERANRLLDLIEIGAAVPAHAEVQAKAQPVHERQPAFQIIGHELREFSTGQYRRSYSLQVLLQRHPYLGPGAMQQHTLVSLR